MFRSIDLFYFIMNKYVHLSMSKYLKKSIIIEVHFY